MHARAVYTWGGKGCPVLERCPQFRSVLIERERGSTAKFTKSTHSTGNHGLVDLLLFINCTVFVVVPLVAIETLQDSAHKMTSGQHEAYHYILHTKIALLYTHCTYSKLATIEAPYVEEIE